MDIYEHTDDVTGTELTATRHATGAVTVTITVPDHDATDMKQACTMHGTGAGLFIRAVEAMTQPTLVNPGHLNSREIASLEAFMQRRQGTEST